MFNFAIPMLCDKRRLLVHKSLQKAADVLEEIQSPFIGLRVRLHYESARCEVALDLLQNAAKELQK